jgi:Protein of unknown function (DUF3054)
MPGKMRVMSDAPDRALARGWPVFAVLDLAALLLFVVAGMRSHGEGAAGAVFARNAVPLAVSWGVFAALLKTYRTISLGTMLRTWIVAVPVALVVRSVWVGSPDSAGTFLTFLGVGLAFTLLFLLIGRGLGALVTGRGYPQRRRA